MGIYSLIDELRGIGHFTIWFLFGFLIFVFGRLFPQQHSGGLTSWALYSPFIPFAFGALAVVPYVIFLLGLDTHENVLAGSYNLFLFYGVIGQNRFVNSLFSNFELNSIMLAIAYLYIVHYYIRLVMRTKAGNAK